MKYTVDRIEDGVAVLEDDMLSMLPVPCCLLPEGAREGSLLSFDGENYVLCADEEAARRRRLFDLQKKLLNKFPAGK